MPEDIRGENSLDELLYKYEPVKPDPKKCSGIMDWSYKNMLYKIHLKRYEELVKAGKAST